MVVLTDFIVASVHPLLLWLYDDDIIWCMLRHMQKSRNLSDRKFVPESDAVLLGNPYPEK